MEPCSFTTGAGATELSLLIEQMEVDQAIPMPVVSRLAQFDLKHLGDDDDHEPPADEDVKSVDEVGEGKEEAAPKPSPCVDAAANVLAPEPCLSVDVTVGVEAVGSEAAVALAPTPSPKMDVATEGKAVALAPTPSLKVDVATERKTVVALSPTPSPKVDAATEGKAVAAPAPTPSPKMDVATEGKAVAAPSAKVDAAMEGKAVVAPAPTPSPKMWPRHLHSVGRWMWQWRGKRTYTQSKDEGKQWWP